MKARFLSPLALLLAFAVGGCASYDGRGLEPGKSTAQDVQALMGPPSDSLDAGAGGRVLYYSRQPHGRQTFAVRVSSDGIMRGIEPILTQERLAKVRVEGIAKSDVRAILGPPYEITRMERQQRDAWEYWMNLSAVPTRVWVSFSDDGLVREVVQVDDIPMYPDRIDPP